jgi:hypothetical protein
MFKERDENIMFKQMPNMSFCYSHVKLKSKGLNQILPSLTHYPSSN